MFSFRKPILRKSGSIKGIYHKRPSFLTTYNGYRSSPRAKISRKFATKSCKKILVNEKSKLIWKDYFMFKEKQKIFLNHHSCPMNSLLQSITYIKSFTLNIYFQNSIPSNRIIPIIYTTIDHFLHRISNIDLIDQIDKNEKKESVCRLKNHVWKSKRRWVTRILDNRSVVQRDESVIKAPSSIRPLPLPASYIKVIITAWTRAGLSNEPGRRIIWFNRVHQPRCPVLFHPGGGSRIAKPFDLAALIQAASWLSLCVMTFARDPGVHVTRT